MSEAGLSWKTARPEFHKSDERTQEAWQDWGWDRINFIVLSSGYLDHLLVRNS
jgi:hypothetical protein